MKFKRKAVQCGWGPPPHYFKGCESLYTDDDPMLMLTAHMLFMC